MTRTVRLTLSLVLLATAGAARAAGPGKPAGYDDATWPEDPQGVAAAPPASADPAALGPGLDPNHDDTSWPVEAMAAGRDDRFAVGPGLPAGHDDATWAPSPAPAPAPRGPVLARAAGQRPGAR